MAASGDLMAQGVRKLIGLKFVAACAFTFAGYPIFAAQNPAHLSQRSDVVPEAILVTASASAPHQYVISPDDVLIIGMYDAPEITGEYRVSPSGEIQLPLLDSLILAAGLTPAQLSELVGDRYRESEIVSHPRVTVAIKESRVHAITIAGAVRKPQMYPVFGKTTLLDVLSQAEGLADDAGSLAVVSRGAISLQAIGQSEILGATGKESPNAGTFSINLTRLMATGDSDLNVDLYPGDRVTVQRAGIVYVVGAVNRPGGFPLKPGQEDMTVIQAVALAEDLKPIAARKKAMIIRKNPAMANGSDEIPVNLSNVLAGRNRDTRLQANDILFVPESPGEKALRRGTEAAISAATWGIIYRW